MTVKSHSIVDSHQVLHTMEIATSTLVKHKDQLSTTLHYRAYSVDQTIYVVS